MKQALLVIDAQESFRSRSYFQDDELPGFLSNLQRLIDRCQAQGILVVQVFHREPGEDSTNPFTAASGQVRTLHGLTLNPDVVVHKEVHSALFARCADGTPLETWLRARGIDRLIVTGIRTEQCCETTARHASDLGFSVRYITDATLTFAMRTRSGRTVSPAEIRERTELVLEGRFAEVASTATLLS